MVALLTTRRKRDGMRGGDDSRLNNSPLGDINGMAGNDNDLNLVKCSVGGIDTTEEDGITDIEKG